MSERRTKEEDQPKAVPPEEWPDEMVAHSDFGDWRIVLLPSDGRPRVTVSHVVGNRSIRWIEQKPSALTDWIGKLVAEAEVTDDICLGHMRDAVELGEEVERLRKQVEAYETERCLSCGDELYHSDLCDECSSKALDDGITKLARKNTKTVRLRVESIDSNDEEDQP